jgi:hypothetical protein
MVRSPLGRQLGAGDLQTLLDTLLDDVPMGALDLAAGGTPALLAIGGVGNSVSVAFEVVCITAQHVVAAFDVVFGTDPSVMQFLDDDSSVPPF